MRNQVSTALVGLLALSTAASASMWRTKPGWAQTKLMFGVSAVGSDEIFVAGGDDRSNQWEDMARVIHSKDAGETYQYLSTPSDHTTFFHLSIAYQNGTSGVSTGVAPLGSAHLYTVDGQTLSKPTTQTMFTECQSVQKIPGVAGGFAATGTFDSVVGLHVSLDGGATWTAKDWGYSGSAWARYGAFPADDAWYIAAGRWGNFAKRAEGHLFEHFVLDRATSKLEFVQATSTEGGYAAAILKSTDQGATWTVQHETTGVANGYFNQIACPTKNKCIAVNEGRNDCRIYATEDGGASWNKVYEATGCSLMAASCTSPTDCFAGGMDSAYNGLVLSTTNFGGEWTATPVTEYHGIMDLDMINKDKGYAVAANVMTSTSSLLVLS